jgi:hypothetical protein
VRRLGFLACVVLLAAGCGGETRSPAMETAAYFDAMQPIAESVGRDVGVAGDALNRFDPASDATWARTAAAVAKAETTTEDAAARVDDLDVARRFEPAQEYYKEAVLSMHDLFASLSPPLARHDLPALEKVVPTVAPALQRIRRIVDSWEADVIFQAKQTGTPVPRWVRESGGVTK